MVMPKYPTWKMVSDFIVDVHAYYLSKTWTIWAVSAKQFIVWYIVWSKNGTTVIKELKRWKIIDAEYHSVVFYHTKSEYNATSGF